MSISDTLHRLETRVQKVEDDLRTMQGPDWQFGGLAKRIQVLEDAVRHIDPKVLLTEAQYRQRDAEAASPVGSVD